MKYLIILNSSPYKNHTSQDSLELILGLANFATQVSLVFINDGVLYLIQNQAPESILRKNLGKIYKGLELYDINNFYVDQDSLKNRQINPIELTKKIILINNKKLADLFLQYNKIINI